MASCRSSGVLTSSAVISSSRCKLVSIHLQHTGSQPTTVRVFDNATSATGKELSRVILLPPPDGTPSVEFDMHGVIASNGLYLDIATGAGLGAAVSVEFV